MPITANTSRGVDSAEARSRLRADRRFVGKLRQATKDAGVAQETVFVVVGDHGFVDAHTNVNLNALLLTTGFAKLAGGKIVPSPDVRISALGGSAALYLREGADPALVGRLEKALQAEIDRRYRGLVELIPRPELEAMGAFPGASLGFAAAEGYMLVAIDAPLPVLPSGALKGMHGYLPTMPGMATGFIAAGPGIRQGELPVVRQLDVAPTVAALLGMRLDQAVGLPIPGVFEIQDPGLGLGIGEHHSAARP
jgi:predicted AlkP superfamily pyrophosphatase or phosphodiesterase